MISIHSLLAEGDIQDDQYSILQAISIHSLLAEGDRISTQAAKDAWHISIHSLLAEGDCSSSPANGIECRFQSTPSSQRETC